MRHTRSIIGVRTEKCTGSPGIGYQLAQSSRSTCFGNSKEAGTVNDSTLADASSEYEVIGEHLTDPLRLLTIDGEGRLFELNLETCSTSPTELTEDWVVDVVDTSQHRRHLGVNAPLPVLVIG